MWRFMIQVIFMDFDKIETYSGLVHQLSLQPLGQAFTGHFPEILAWPLGMLLSPALSHRDWPFYSWATNKNMGGGALKI